MKNELIEKMKMTGRLELTFWESLTHYMIVFAFVFPLAVISINSLSYNADSSISVRTPLEMSLFGVPFALLGILSYFVQYKRLQFKIVETNLSREKLNELLDRTSDELEWIPVIKTKDIFIAKTIPKWWTGSWGEQITILIDKERLMINSICDPEQRTSVTSMGRNKKNVNRLIENIKKANCL